MHLTVAGSLEPLADALAEQLAVPLADPFASEVVVVPGDGLRRWLVARLGRRLGATAADADDGVVANVDFAFPATLVRRALGEGAGLGRWAVGPLTWAVLAAVVAEPDHFGQRVDAVRARAVADLFDRYALHRPGMLARWAAGADVDGVGAPLAVHHRWQPALWRRVRADLGPPSDVERLDELVAELRATGRVAGAPVADVLPSRVFLFGLASLPTPQLDVLAALSTHLDVHVLAPAASPVRWARLRDELGRSPEVPRPLPRADDAHAVGGGHPLVDGWGRASREAHLLLLESATAAGAAVHAPSTPAPPGADAGVLARLRHAVATDATPPGAPAAGGPDERPLLAAGDRSLRWHRCFGTGRQVEVLRDALLHLFEELGPDGTPRYEPRDVAVLCTDIVRFAPLVEAVFAGDPAHGRVEIPVRVADRTLRQDSALLDAAGALLELLDGRFRASEVLGFLSRTPVRRRIGLDVGALDRIAGWVEATNVRWGRDHLDQESFGVPGRLRVHTWRDGLDQLLLGATMADRGLRLGPDDVVPHPDVEGDDVELAGRLSEFVTRLGRSVDALGRPAPVDVWCARVAEALRDLCEVDDDEAWQWAQVERVLAEMAAEATVDGHPRTADVDPADLAALLGARLGGGGARARFGTGAVTVSSLTAQRGVPHRVVCLLGLDAQGGAGSMPSAEDLTGDPPCVGDRDPRSEQRAQLLDAVLAAGERLILVSDGRDVRTNAEVPAAVAVAELFDVVDATVRLDDPTVPARVALTVDHPRQGWSQVNFVPGALDPDGPWSFDDVALEAARSRADAPPAVTAPYLDEPLAPAPEEGPVTVHRLLSVCRNPAQVFLRDRMGVELPEPDEPRDDLIPLDLRSRSRWRVRHDLLEHRRGLAGPWDDGARRRWAHVQQRRGAVPPGAFGDDDLRDADDVVSGILAAAEDEMGGPIGTSVTVPVDVDVALPADGRAGGAGDDPGAVQVVGDVGDVVGDTVLTLTVSRLRDHDWLQAWVRVALLAHQDPTRPWRAVTVGLAPSGRRPVVQRVALRDPAAAAEVLTVVVDLHRRALCDAVPTFAATTRAWRAGGMAAARKAFVPTGYGADGDDRWIAALFGPDFDQLVDLGRRPDETGPGWGDDECRLACWAERLWGTFERTTVPSDDLAPATADELAS